MFTAARNSAETDKHNLAAAHFRQTPFRADNGALRASRRRPIRNERAYICPRQTASSMKLFVAGKYKPVHFEWADAVKHAKRRYRP